MQQLRSSILSGSSGFTEQSEGVFEVDYRLTVEAILGSGVYNGYHDGFTSLAARGEFQVPASKRGQLISVPIFSVVVGKSYRSFDNIQRELGTAVELADLWMLHAACRANPKIHRPAGILALGSSVSSSDLWTPSVVPSDLLTPSVVPTDSGKRFLWLTQGSVFKADIRILYTRRGF